MAGSRNRDQDDAELRKLLPRYVKGHLAGPTLARVEAYLARSAQARAEVEGLRRLERGPGAGLGPRGRDAAFDRFMQQLVPSASVRVASVARRRAQPRWRAPALGLAVVLGAVEATVIGVLLHEREARWSGTPAEGAAGARLYVTFRSETPEAQIRDLLHGVGAKIVAGPNSRGVYTLEVAPEGVEAALTRLSARSDVVSTVRPAALPSPHRLSALP